MKRRHLALVLAAIFILALSATAASAAGIPIEPGALSQTSSTHLR